MLDIFRTLPTIMEHIDADDAAREPIVLIAWKKIAGEMLGEHTVPQSFGNSRLVVAVSGRTWQKHLEDLSPQMIFKLNSLLGSPLVRFVEFRIDEAAISARRTFRKIAAAEAQARSRAVQNEITPEISAAAENIADEDLRQAFLMAAASCIDRKQRFSS